MSYIEVVHVSILEGNQIYILNLDLGKQTILRKTLIPVELSKIRGGHTGSIGGTLAKHADRLWVAGKDCVFKLDPDTLNIQACYWSYDCTDIQQVHETDGGLKISSGNGKIYYMDFLGEYKAMQNTRLTERITTVRPPYISLPDRGCILNLDRGEIIDLGGGPIMDNGFVLVGDKKITCHTSRKVRVTKGSSNITEISNEQFRVVVPWPGGAAAISDTSMFLVSPNGSTRKLCNLFSPMVVLDLIPH